MANVETSWKSLNLSSLLSEDLVSTVASVGDVAAPLISTLKAAVVLLRVSAAQVADSTDDPLMGAVSALQDLIEEVLSVFEDTGVFMSWHVPKGFRSAVSAETLLSRFASSLTDPLDPNSPNSDSPVYFSTVLAITSSDSVYDLQTSLSPFMEILGLPSVAPKLPAPESPSATRSASLSGASPNWASVVLADFPLFGPFVQYLRNASNTLSTKDNQMKFMLRNISLVERKIGMIEKQADEVMSAIDALQDAMVSSPALTTLSVNGFGDSTDQADAIRSALRRNDAPEMGRFSAGVALHVQAKDPGPVSAFNRIFGGI